MVNNFSCCHFYRYINNSCTDSKNKYRKTIGYEDDDARRHVLTRQNNVKSCHVLFCHCLSRFFLLLHNSFVFFSVLCSVLMCTQVSFFLFYLQKPTKALKKDIERNKNNYYYYLQPTQSTRLQETRNQKKIVPWIEHDDLKWQ